MRNKTNLAKLALLSLAFTFLLPSSGISNMRENSSSSSVSGNEKYDVMTYVESMGYQVLSLELLKDGSWSVNALDGRSSVILNVYGSDGSYTFTVSEDLGS